MSLQLSWALKATIDNRTIIDFDNRLSLTTQYDHVHKVPAKGSVRVTFSAGWTNTVQFWAMDGGEEHSDFTWAFDDGKPRTFDDQMVITGTAACQAVLSARKSISFVNGGATERYVRLLIGQKAAEVGTATAGTDSYVVPVVRVEVYPSPEFAFEPAIPYFLKPAAAVRTTLPNHGCLSVPVTKIQEGYSFGAFVLSASSYIDGLEYSVDGGAHWQMLYQSVVSFGVDACAYLPPGLKSIELRNESGEDVQIAVVLADWVPPFASSSERG